jgi:site-specific recombinase XerD
MDFDAYVISLREEYARRTVSDICCSLRSFCKFLYETKRSSVDLSTSIFSPKIHRFENPRRIISWNDVQRILEAVDRKSPGGKRDYAILLMMATYGMGAGEIIHLTLEDVNWKETTLHVKRPKTGVQFCLPLLPAIATALADYLQHGRPEFTQSRNIFLTMKSPHRKLACAVTIRHILHSHAQKAGLCTEHLGTHVLRHTQACRQMELGFQPKVIGDILGHRNPESTSAYLRVSIELLRTLSLPVPTHE